MIRKSFVPVLTTIILCAAIMFVTNFGYERPVHAVEVPQNLIAEMAQRMEALENEIRLLRKNIQILSDLLDDIAKTSGKTQPAPVSKPVTAVAQPAKWSPRQIDRPALGRAQQNPVYLAKIALEFPERPEIARILGKLITTKSNSSLLNSYRENVTEWLDTPPNERQWEFCLSPKMYAWTCYLTCKGEKNADGTLVYDNPKKDKNLYPNG